MAIITAALAHVSDSDAKGYLCAAWQGIVAWVPVNVDGLRGDDGKGQKEGQNKFYYS